MSNWWHKWGSLIALLAPAVLAGLIAWLTLRADERYLQRQEFQYYWQEMKEDVKRREEAKVRDLARIEHQLDLIAADVKALLKESKK